MKLETLSFYKLSTLDMKHYRTFCTFYPDRLSQEYLDQMSEIIKPEHRFNTYVDPDEMNDFISVFLYSIYFVIVYETFFT